MSSGSGVGAKLKLSQGRDDDGKGKGVVPAVKVQASDSKHKTAAGAAAGTISVSKSVVVKGKATPSSSKTVTKTTTVRAKTQKKVYTLPGQKYDPPEEREPLRIFYESLSRQIPSSEMAEFWMMEHGMLSPERAKKAYERKQRRQQQLRTGTPIKSLKAERSESLKKPQVVKNGDLKAKKRVNYSNDDADFIVKRKKVK